MKRSHLMFKYEEVFTPQKKLRRKKLHGLTLRKLSRESMTTIILSLAVGLVSSIAITLMVLFLNNF